MKPKTRILFFYAAIAIALAVVVIYRHSILPEVLCNWMDDTIFFRFYSVQKKIYKAAYYRLLPVFGVQQAAILATLLTAQSGNESDGWTSHVFVTDNNAFGVKLKNGNALRPYQSSKGLAANDGGNYGHYSCVENSARDAATWLFETPVKLQAFAAVTGLQSYVQALYNNDYFEGETVAAYDADVEHYYNLLNIA